jgi:hypothetical protein
MKLSDDRSNREQAVSSGLPRKDRTDSSLSRSLISRANGIMIFLIFAFQASAIVYARFHETRYFCWAPFDIQTAYSMHVFGEQGRELSKGEIRERYQMSAESVEQRSYQHIFNAVKQYETSYGKNDGYRVTIEYTVNGGEPLAWQFPES